MSRSVISENLINSPEVNGDYWLEDGTKVEPLLVQSIIKKYNDLKFQHLLRGDILREDLTGEVRMIARKYTRSNYSSTKVDIIVTSTGWRLDREFLDNIKSRVEENPDLLDIYKSV